jgi:flagellar biogenesis protein FliO
LFLNLLPAQDSLHQYFAKDTAAASNSFKNDHTADIDSYLIKAALISSVLIISMYLILRLLKKKTNNPHKAYHPKIEILSRRQIAPKQTLIIINAEGKKLLIGSAEHSVNLLYDLGDIDEREMEEVIASKTPFNHYLEKFSQLGKKGEQSRQ